MKSRYFTASNQKAMKKVAKEIARDEINTIYTEALNEIAPNIYALVFHTMAIEYGWGSIRLNRLKDSLEQAVRTMKSGALGKPYGCDDLKQWLLDTHGIDLFNPETD